MDSSCFFPLCRMAKAAEEMGHRRVAKSTGVLYESLCEFLYYASARARCSSLREFPTDSKRFGLLAQIEGPLNVGERDFFPERLVSVSEKNEADSSER